MANDVGHMPLGHDPAPRDAAPSSGQSESVLNVGPLLLATQAQNIGDDFVGLLPIEDDVRHRWMGRREKGAQATFGHRRVVIVKLIR
jgi:hypothetical protein